ncbi:prefoldin, alpha subunit [Kwoniella mangroviensis CBS 10435]|uniref:Prefoldin, alpha subunit n=1 Tax=Kwoniella mangroviensis CBS 10435 TaxID=1331196 RepID=A0A1B9IQS9_9TREE|nr:prefoldin, alpha subunit [Kwoniella mangroviensis CBS 10435]
MSSLFTATAPNQPERAQIYSAHLQSTLLPELEVTRYALITVEHDISEYDDLLRRLNQLEQADERGVETLSELGAGVWVETRISDTKTVTLDLGLDVHMDMPLSEAKGYVSKKIDALKKKGDGLSKKEEYLVWQVGQFHGALPQSSVTPM